MGKGISVDRMLRRGDKLRCSDCPGVARVMAVADGWVMLRFPRAIPFLRYVRDLQADHSGWELSQQDASRS